MHTFEKVVSLVSRHRRKFDFSQKDCLGTRKLTILKYDFYWFLLIFIGFCWFLLIFTDFHWFLLIFNDLRTFVATFLSEFTHFFRRFLWNWKSGIRRLYHFLNVCPPQRFPSNHPLIAPRHFCPYILDISIDRESFNNSDSTVVWELSFHNFYRKRQTQRQRLKKTQHVWKS